MGGKFVLNLIKTRHSLIIARRILHFDGILSASVKIAGYDGITNH